MKKFNIFLLIGIICAIVAIVYMIVFFIGLNKVDDTINNDTMPTNTINVKNDTSITNSPSSLPKSPTILKAETVNYTLEVDNTGNVTTTASDLFMICYDSLIVEHLEGDIHISGLPGTEGLEIKEGEYNLTWYTDDNTTCSQTLILQCPEIITEVPIYIITPIEVTPEVTEEPVPTEEITPSPSPTEEPTEEPTPTPTQVMPTEKPTIKPSPEVTSEVTKEVTKKPTKEPTKEVTKEPTPKPTKNESNKTAKLSQDTINITTETSEDELIGLLSSIYVTGTNQYASVDQNSLYKCLDGLAAGKTGKYVVNYVAVDNSFTLPLTVIIK